MSAYSIATRGLAGRKIPQGTLTPIGALLFSGSEPGAWYDPSYLSTLFQDEAGTTPVTAVEQLVGRMLDLSGRGNHATQATTTKRPVLSRRVNLLTKTEQFEDAAWVKSGVGTGAAPVVTANDAIAPDGTMTADRIYLVLGGGTSSSDWSWIYQNNARHGGVAEKFYVWLKAAAPADVGRVVILTGFSWGAVTLSADWTRHELPALVDASVVLSYGVRLRGSETPGAAPVSLHVWGASLTLATDAHLPYQWVNTATDYDADPAKFPAYRRLDGVDDSHASATGGGGTAGFFFSASVTPQGGAGAARTLFSDAGTNTGYIVRLNVSNQLELAAGNGTAYTTISTAGTLAVGSTDIVQAWDDGTNLNVKIGNGATASIARPTVSAGTAGYTMGQDNGASTGYFNGRVYSTIYRKDSGLTQVQREAVALYQRQKARMP